MEVIYKFARYVSHFVFFFTSNVYCLFAFLVWLILLMPLRFFAPSLYWKMEENLFRMLESIVISWIHTGGYKVLECGEDVAQIADDEAVVLVNHQSTSDTPLMMLALYDKGKASGKLMWIMYKLFKFTNFGLVSVFRQDFFIDQGKETRHLQLDLLKDHLKTIYLRNKRKWIVVFPEGGFLYKRLESSQEYAKKYDFPVLNHTTLPRQGALQTILDNVGEPYQEAVHTIENDSSDTLDSNVEHRDPQRPVKWIIDVTLAYKGGEALDMLGMCIGYNPMNDVLINWRCYRVRDIPREEIALRDWMYERYSEKDELLRDYYQNRVIPGVSENAQVPALKTKYIRFDFLELVLNHIFFFASFYIQLVYIWSPLFSLFCSLCAMAF